MRTKTKKNTVEARLDRLEQIAQLVLKHISAAGDRNRIYANKKMAMQADAEADRLWCMQAQENQTVAIKFLQEMERNKS
ncbi:MAG: hypothetical protein WC444_04870 [Candidatus Paceibacterota bacterium]